jgi:predicted nucleic acid-binding protein
VEPVAPRLLALEVLNVAARRWKWTADELDAVAVRLDEIGWRFVEPDLRDVARWAGQGLSAYDATYVAVAEAAGCPLVTDDARILAVAPHVAVPLTN